MERFLFNLQRFDAVDTMSGTDGDDNLSGAGDSMSVDAKAGNDNVTFLGDNNSIDGGADNDNINITGEKNSIDGGADNDNINITGEKNSIDGGAGDDNINVKGNHNTVSGGTGNDSIDNYTPDYGDENHGTVYIYSGGNDSIFGFGTDDFLLIEGYSWETIRGADKDWGGADVIVNVLDGTTTVGTITLEDYANPSYERQNKINIVSSKEELEEYNIIYNDEDGKNITGDDSKNVIINAGNNLSVTSGAGDDYIENNGENVTIDAGDGNNDIKNVFGNKVTLTSGTGNDYVEFTNYGAINVYVYGGGNDTVDGRGGKFRSIVLGDASIKSSLQSNNMTLLRLSNGNSLTLLNLDTKSIFSSLDEVPKVNFTRNEQSNIVVTGNGEAGAINYIDNEGKNVTINGSEFDDHVWNINDVDNTIINLGAGNDSVENMSGSNQKIDTGDGDDYIDNYASNVSITAGDGNDTIWNVDEWEKGRYSSINGGAGDDIIDDSGWNNTISGGTGNDSVNFHDGSNHVYIYEGGNDTISGMNWGNGIIVIEGYNWSMSHENDGDDTLRVDVLDDNNSVVGTLTVLTWNRTFNIVSSREETAAFSNFIQTDDELNPIEGTSGNDYLVNGQSDKTISAGDGDDWINHIQGTNTTINAGAGDDKITNWFGSPTINGGAGDDFIESWNKSEATVPPVFIGGTGNDTIYGVGDAIVRYTEGDGDDVLNGFGENTTLAIASDTYSTKKSGDDIIVTVGEGHLTLVGASWISSINVVGGTFEEIDDGEAPEEETASWRLNGTTATYGLEGEDPIVTVNGVKSPSGLSINVDDKVVTVSIAALNETNITISDGYTLALSKSAPQPSMQDPTWSFRDSIAICQVSASTAGYMLEDNQIKYVPEGTGSTIAISGVATTNGITINGTTVTISKAALEGSEVVSINDGYTLALAQDVDKLIVMSGNLTYNGTAAIYTSAGVVGGYKIDNNQIIYVADKSSEQVTISGVAAATGITRKDDTFTIPNAVLNRSNVTISDGYNLSLASDVAQPVSTAKGWTLDETTAIYREAGKSEGYSVEGNQIIYTAASGNDSVVAVEGIKSAKGLYLNADDKIVTVYKSALNESNITISDGYTLALDGAVKNLGEWSLDGTKATYQGSKTPPYQLIDNEVIYTAPGEDEILIELDGMAKAPTFNDAGAIQITADNFEEEAVSVLSNSGGFKFEIAEDSYAFGSAFKGSGSKEVVTNNAEYFMIDGGAGSDSIVNDAENVSINGGAGNDKIINNASNVEIAGGAGNDNVTISGEQAGNIFAYSNGDGKDILYGFTETDSIKIADGSAVEANIDGNDIEFRIGNGSITIKDGARSEREVMVIDSAGSEIETLSGNKYTKDGVISQVEGGELGIVLTPTFKSTYTANAVAKVDGSQTKKGITIDASTEGIELIGGAGKDNLISGEQEFAMTGGKGNDIFTYNSGTGIITDYSEKGSNGKDKIAFGEGLSVQEYEISGDNVILSFGESDSLTIEGGKDAEISFGARKSTVSIYTDDGVFDGKRKSIKLVSGVEEFDASKLSKLETIDGSAAEGEIAITGNKKANYITAGANGSTLSGGKGKDSLVGGSEADTFIFDSKNGKGNKVIIGYSDDEGDQLVLNNGATISEVKAKGGDLVLKVDKSKVTLKDNGGAFTFVENDVTKTYSGGLLISEDKESVSLTSAADRAIDLTSDAYAETTYQNVSAALLKKAVAITGDVEDNELTGGKGKDTIYGGDGSDTLRGGKGNDTLWGGDGDDTFTFWAGDGTDFIADYAAGDMLQIMDKNGRKEAAFTSAFDDDNSLTLSVKGGGKVNIANTSGQTQFRINDTTYTRQGNTLVK